MVKKKEDEIPEWVTDEIQNAKFKKHEELNKQGEDDPASDYEADEMMRKIAYNQDNLIIESRTAAFLFRKWGFEKDTIHIYIKCSIKEGAKRIFEQKQKEGTEGRNESADATLKDQIQKLKSN